MSKPSVLFINRVYPPVTGATGRVLRDLAQGFASAGWEVTVVTTGRRRGKERDGAVKIIRVRGAERPRGIFSYLIIWVKLFIAALRVPAGHLIVTMTDPPMLVAAGRLLRRLKKNRHIHWCHDVYPDIFPALNVRLPGFLMRPAKKLSRLSIQECDKTIVIGRCMAKYLAHSGIDPRMITVIPNWPDPELLKPEGEPHSYFERPDHLPVQVTINGAKPTEQQLRDMAPKFRVLYAGNLGRAHPLKTIIEAAAILDHESPEIEFVFVGDGPRFDEVARERGKRGLHNIRLLPYQPQSRIRQVMESGDVHLISMREDAAGMLVPSKLYAALAVGRPCIFIGPAQSEAARVVHDFHAGVIVAQGDAQALAEQIHRYRHNGEEWFAAHAGAEAAGRVFVPAEAIHAWIERAWSVVEPDIKGRTHDGA
jgi:glycosyltransferase involved in cell wall biosynthesis